MTSPDGPWRDGAARDRRLGAKAGCSRRCGKAAATNRGEDLAIRDVGMSSAQNHKRSPFIDVPDCARATFLGIRAYR